MGAQDAPNYYIKAFAKDGRGFRVDSSRILSFKYVDSERKADICTITFDNFDLANFDDPLFRKGRLLECAWGYPGRVAPARFLVIQKVTGFEVLTIECKAVSILMNVIPQCRTFENKTHSEVVTELAKLNGFKANERDLRNNVDIETTDEKFDIICQPGLTDAQFIKSLAAANGFEFYVDHTGFHWHQRRLNQRPLRVYTWYTGSPTIVGYPTVDNDVTGRAGLTVFCGRDPRTKKDICEIADNKSTADRTVMAPSVEIVFDPEANTNKVERKVGSKRTKQTPAEKATQAKKRAEGLYKRLQQLAVKMTMTVVGDPLLTAKSVVQLKGFGRRLSHNYYVPEVTHTIGTGGYVCELKMISDTTGAYSVKSVNAEGLSAFEASPTAEGKVNSQESENDPDKATELEFFPEPNTNNADEVRKSYTMTRRSRKGQE